MDVGIIMGSQSDWETMRHAADVLEQLGVAHEVKIISAHRTPQRLVDYATTAKERGLKCIIAGAGGAAHLPGHVRQHDSTARFWRPCSIQGVERHGQPSIHRANAGRRSGGNSRHWAGWGCECRIVGGVRHRAIG